MSPRDVTSPFEIVTRPQESEDAGDWRADRIGSENGAFPTLESAREAIEALRALGGEWGECEYGVRDSNGRLVDEGL